MFYISSCLFLIAHSELMYWVLPHRLLVNPYACLVPKKGEKKVLFCKSERSTGIGKADSHLLLLHFISAPSGYLEWWMKLSRTHVINQFNIHLFWKVHARDKFLSSCHDPTYLLIKTLRLALIYLCFFFPSCQASKWFHANSQNVSYVVSVQKQSGKRAQVCSTRRNYCTFQLRTKTAKLYLNAVNAAGKSNPTKVHILFCKGTALILRNYLKMMARVIVFFNKMHATCFVSVVHSALSNVSAAPHHDGALMVRWRSVASYDLRGFIVEWRPLLNKTMSLIQFETTDRNQTSLVLKGMLYSRLCIFIQIPRTLENMLLFCLTTLLPFSSFLTLLDRQLRALQTLCDLCVSSVYGWDWLSSDC